MGGSQKSFEVVEGSVIGVNVAKVGDVVPIILQGRREKGKEPDAVDAHPRDVVESFGEAAKVADAVSVAVREGADRDFVKDGVLVPISGHLLTHSGCRFHQSTPMLRQ